MFGLSKNEREARRAKQAERAKAATQAKSAELFDADFQRQLEYLALAARRAVSGQTRANRASKKKGSGIEFADHREYAPGDDLRALDWNLYARSSRLLIRLFEEEQDVTVHLILDASASMSALPEMDRFAKRLIAAFAYLSLHNLDRISLQAGSVDLWESLPAGRGKARIFRVFEFLTKLQYAGKTDLAKTAQHFATTNPRPGLAILVSDLHDPEGFERAINVLRYARLEVLVIQPYDSQQAELPPEGELQLVDAETGDTLEITLTPALREKVRAAESAQRDRAARFCAEKQVTYAAVDLRVPFTEAFLSLIRTRVFG